MLATGLKVDNPASDWKFSVCSAGSIAKAVCSNGNTDHPRRRCFPQPLLQRLGGPNIKRIAAGVMFIQRYQPAGEGLIEHGAKAEVQQPTWMSASLKP